MIYNNNYKQKIS